MPGLTSSTERALWRPIAWADAFMNRLYGWRYNPLYQSGGLVLALLAVVTLTGIYLLLFYRIGAPYESVARMNGQVWSGRWIRALHRYASDAAILAAVIHALRLFCQGRSWGPRALAWLSGLALLFVILICGWTGYVMVWDTQGLVLAMEGARLLDAVPMFAEPISRAFVGEADIPNAFFFLNLFLHVALPIGLGTLLWIHVSRVARAALLPPRRLLWSVVGLLFVLSLVWPVAMAPKADLFQVPGRAPFDLFYSFWLPLSRALPAPAVWGVLLVLTGLLAAIPWLSRPPAAAGRAPSWVDERHCTGCEQCYLDCPYEAIAMHERREGPSDQVARVDPGLCVSCGICAGSCAPMRVGPPVRTGRDQLLAVRAFVERERPGADDIVLVGCDRAAAAGVGGARLEGALLYPFSCAGNVHTSLIEYLIRTGTGGVMVVACPPRDCWNREGAKWLEQRLYHEREAELQARVDRRRIRLVHAGSAETAELIRELNEFRSALAELRATETEAELDLIRMCEVSTPGVEG